MRVSFVVLFAALVIGIGVLIVVAAVRERERLDALAAWARAGGWAPSPDDGRWVSAFSGAPFGEGQQRRASNAVERTVEGHQQVAFDYQYVTYETVTVTDANGGTRTERRRREHDFRVVAVELAAPLGPLELRREGFGQRFLTALGAQDVEIELDDFNRRYRVTAQDPKLAVDLLNPRTVERLLAHEDASLRLGDGWALSYDLGRLEPAWVEERLSVLRDMVSGVPRFVWLDHGHDPSGRGTTQPLGTSDER